MSPLKASERRGEKPLCVDLFCGLGGWTEGFLAEGYDVVGFDIEQHVYGEHRYPAELVLQDVRTIHGKQFRNATVIVASSPCQEFSYRAMPWKRAKALPPPYLGMELFAQAARIQREACEASGRFIPMIQENVRGAQKWVGKAAWHYGSFYLWGDVPALMPMTARRAKVGSLGWSDFAKTGVKSKGFNTTADQLAHGRKDVTGTHLAPSHHHPRSESGRRTDVGNGARFTSREEIVTTDEGAGTKGYAARLGQSTISRRYGSKSKARKAASAKIAKIPFPLARHIAQVYASLHSEVAQ